VASKVNDLSANDNELSVRWLYAGNARPWGPQYLSWAARRPGIGWRSVIRYGASERDVPPVLLARLGHDAQEAPGRAEAAYARRCGGRLGRRVMSVMKNYPADGFPFEPVTTDDRYRYEFVEDISSTNNRTCVFVMLNPATERKEDDAIVGPTRGNCIQFADAQKCGRLITVNLFARRARKPELLTTVDDPIGPKNDRAILAAAHEAAATGGLLIYAWGNDVQKLRRKWRETSHRNRVAVVMRLLATGVPTIQPMALRVNDTGAPRHPSPRAMKSSPHEWIPQPYR
jgi:hypothetical protein